MKRLALILLAGLLAAGLAAPLRATTPSWPQPDPWFVHELEIDPASLPSGVRIEPDTRTIVNNIDTPLYFVKRLAEPMRIGMLPNDVLPKWRLVNNELHLFSSGYWRPVQGGTEGIMLFATMVSHTEQELRGPAGPGRPENAVPPDPVTIRFAGFFGAQLIEFEGVLSYDVYRGYDPGVPAYSTWFGQQALVITTPLPDGLRIVDVSPPGYGRVLKRILNATSTPFHSFERFPEPVEWIRKLPDNVWPQFRLLSGRSYMSVSSPGWRFSLIGPGGTTWSAVDKEGWVPLSENVHVVAEWATWTNPGFELNNIRKDCRPAVVELPADKPFELLTYLGSKPHTLRGRVRFALNPDYDPIAGQGPVGCGSCTGALCDACFSKEGERKRARPTAAEVCGTEGLPPETPKH